MKSTEVVHCKRCKYDIYIGRKKSKYHFGNPFEIGKDGNRKDVIKKFRLWITKEDYHDIEPRRRDWIIDNMYTLKGKILGCWCFPKECHGDIYVELLGG